MTSEQMVKLGIAIVEYMEAQGLDKKIEQAAYLMANPMVKLDLSNYPQFTIELEEAIAKAHAKPCELHTLNNDVTKVMQGVRNREFGNPALLAAAKRSKTVGKPQNNSGCAENHGYAETETVGKPQNNSDDNFARWYAEMMNTDYQIPNYSAIRNTIQAAKRVKNSQEAAFIKYVNNATSGQVINTINDLSKVCARPRHTLDDMIEGLLSMYNLKGCLDKTVVAVLVTHDGIFFGINGVEYLPNKCPREGKGINQGYAQCQHVCRQPHHAETMAIQQAKVMGVDLKLKSIIHVYGANGVCSNCLEVLRAEGVTLGKTSNNLADFESDWSKDYAVSING